MNQRHFATILILTTLALVALATGCTKPLPEPESEGAKLYVQYCSGSGCHGPIYPGGSSAKYWELQYERMLDIMQRAGWQLPSAREETVIMDYLERNSLQ